MVALLLTTFAMSLAQLGPEPPTGGEGPAGEEEIQRIELRGDEAPEPADPVTGPSAPDRAGATPLAPTPDPATGGTPSPEERDVADDPATEGIGGTGAVADDDSVTRIEIQGTEEPASPDGPAVVPPEPAGQGGTGEVAQQGQPAPTVPQPPPIGSIDESAIPGLGGTGALTPSQQIQQQIGLLQRQMAENQIYAQQLEQQIFALQSQLEALQAREAEDEAARQARIAALNDATDLLSEAQAVLMTGDAGVTGQLTNARAEIEEALTLVDIGTGEMESRWMQEAIAAIDTAVVALNNLDLFNARVALGMATVYAGNARTAAMER